VGRLVRPTPGYTISTASRTESGTEGSMTISKAAEVYAEELTASAPDMSRRATWELIAMLRALGSMPALNTPTEEARLEAAREELARRHREA
jgi:hypothetical protein